MDLAADAVLPSRSHAPQPPATVLASARLVAAICF